MATSNLANSYITIGAANQIGMPVQPAFLATLSSQQANVTGAGAEYTIVCNTVIKDQGSNYNNGTGTFTAPVTGVYIFSGQAYLSGATILSSILLKVDCSNRAFINGYSRTASNVDARTEVNCLADMDAADTALLKITGSGEALNTDDLECVSGSDSRTAFSGYLAV